MREKIKNQKGFIRIPLLIIIIISVAVFSIGATLDFEYYKTSKVIKESKQLAGEEKYDKAVKKLETIQNNPLVKDLGLKKREINNEVKVNKRNLEDKLKFTQALGKIKERKYKEAINLFSQLSQNSFYYQKAQTKIEEVKRKIVEGQLGEEKVAKAEIEAKARQEESERKLKEQQLSAKEAEEKRMDSDNDGDGLTYREELKLGTSDSNRDSDGDGIIDSKDAHPAGGGRDIAQTFAWSYGGFDWTWTGSVQGDWYDYYKNKPRVAPESTEYVTGNDPFIRAISKKISEAATKDNLNKVSLAVAFVQSLSYVSDVYTGYDEYPKYPVETFVEKNGDCEDTSYLAASIISAMGIGDVLIVLPGHMAVGVWTNPSQSGTYYEINGRRYYYFETTGENWQLGEIPDKFRFTPATLIKIPSGDIIKDVSPRYVKPCYASPNFPGYYSDGEKFYSDSQCNYLAHCMPYKEYYVNPQITTKLYWDSGCSQEVTIGCYKSKIYSGKFYISGTAWYYDSKCTDLYKSMACDYPSFWNYSCISQSSYDLKKSNCDYYKSSPYFQDLAESCDEELVQCRRDIEEYQRKLDEYNQCKNRKEY